jgi:formamidopyrimidine-DNA glycosylase
VALNRRIAEVQVASDPIVFEGVPAARFRRALLGRRVVGAGRHGKHLWIELDRRPWPCLHFGMTGGLHTPAVAPKLRSSRVRYRESPDARASDAGVEARRDGQPSLWPPRFWKLRLTLDDGGEIVLADARRLGRIRLRHDPPAEPPVSALGFDALLSLPPPAEFIALLRERSAPMKALLLDQSFAAGVGNWIADEVLYQARIDPRRRAGTLTDAEARRVRAKIRDIVATAVRVGESARLPRGWLFHRRWGKDPRAVTARGERIRYATIGGRTTAWVPAVQR